MTKERGKKMKKFFMLFMTVIMSVFLLVGCGTSEQDAETITGLQATVDDLQKQVEEYSAVKSELETANNSITKLQSELDALKTEKEEILAKLEMLYKIESLDETMYAVSDADIYDDLYGVALGDEPAGTISAEQELKITGKSVVTGWYEIELDGKKQYVSGSLVSRNKSTEISKATTATSKTTTTTTTTETGTDGTDSVVVEDNSYDENSVDFGEEGGMFTDMGIPEANYGTYDELLEGAHEYDVQ